MLERFGALLIVLGTTAQALRWLLKEAPRLVELRDASKTRVERLGLRREVIAAQWDWFVWAVIALGAWLLFVSTW